MKKKQFFENFIHGIFLVLGLITVGCVLLISVYLIISGIPAIRQGFRWKQSWEKSAERKTVWTAAAAIPTRTRQKQNCLYPPPALIFWRLPSALPTVSIRASRTLIWSGCRRSAAWWTSHWFYTAPPVCPMKRYANVFGVASARSTMRRIFGLPSRRPSARYCKPIPKPLTPKNTVPPVGRP